LYRKVVENLFWAVGALLMSMSSVIVVINAMTLRKAKLQV